jgi:hypothetical protein
MNREHETYMLQYHCGREFETGARMVDLTGYGICPGCSSRLQCEWLVAVREGNQGGRREAA